MSKLCPTAGNCVVKRDDARKVSKGGIALPDSSQDKPQRGKIIALGKGKMLENGQYAPVELVDGATCYFGRYAGADVDIDGETYTVLSMDEIKLVTD